ncbi:aminotransferase class III-fold pyridoxal phosphate-dependent enzyme [Croceitalea rosinachiae]|uniref:Aminotransferase class III-fold pyridoxal phosphate-dependent enzyme n=1 Tax=Croceitalea rosinachiae TaxID=3075596 RepID=A0ABU3ACP5_9FLAO|nr:aminotransferase class III-fold pyridoxal phosphate-dependent enzyme [Croceitalea sp. F388]MDT0607650.1 aminotransferase class III-fold pyridoxal phosphate-dependent enzyme [Croceitalea sp. F388]
MNLEQLLTKEFGFKSQKIKKLVGYDNKNYLVTENNSRYILKTYHYSQYLWDVLGSENKVLIALKDSGLDTVPSPIAFLDGSFIKNISHNKEQIIIRLLTFLEGEFVGDTTPTMEIANAIGAFVANMNKKLNSLENYVLRARKWEWDLQYFPLNKKYLSAITDSKDRNLVLYFFQHFEKSIVPVLPTLRKQIIHNDANEWNILVKNNEVTGIIDFGDIAYSPLVNELAIAITYIAYDKEKPLNWVIALLKGYHSVNPVLEEEIDLLYYLIAARLCTSVCNSAHSKKTDPENNYASISEVNAWKTLRKWIRLNPIQVKNEFRQAVGFSPIEQLALDRALAKRFQHISPILSISYQKPIQMEAAAFQYMYDTSGNTFLDAYNNIPHVGHSHPKVVAAGQRQMSKLNTNTRYVYDVLGEYAEKLLSKFPKPLNKVFFVNSGSAASDLAIRMAKTHTKRQHIMVMEHGYHGNTQTSIDISDYKFSNKKGQGQKEYILKTSIPDSYRGKYTTTDAGVLFAKDAINELESTNESIAAFIAEPIVGCGGQVPLADGYLKEIYPAVRKQGGVCISDEVQTGFSRLGKYFWGFEMHEVIPDIVVLGKPMGNGHPIGAVVVTDEIAASFEKGVEFFSSFGGNPVSCAVGLTVLEVIEEEGLQQQAEEVGNYYQKELRKLQRKYPVIGDVRGAGLFIGIDMVHPETKNTNHQLAQYLKNELRNQNILISTDGPDDSVLKTKPPLCFTKNNVDEVIDAIDNAMLQFYK